ncbi:hypothetical protein FVEN_g10938 [Fusarium venenatum]|uniref:Heterokaryon incompatibility domain-containing protein n=1 Tax=Fusarium venenatum TaxID=56646 RepID=A0A2L2TQF7_9HYPO|nr:uncharacterized protein FVRRES_03739 [Fusarium venenatum]KAG8350896.1 hypothetical protein FVEN_g10938 [Fusarium venenatum]KAH7003262.1 heterokaryon incompatibility protein-domain-containing protein [Fusarium venenatum]CEI67227.1 unnamed protein product [Fusarium venenatum]
MPPSTFCARCVGIFQGHYVPSNILVQHDLVDSEAAWFMTQSLGKGGNTEWKVRLDKDPEKEAPAPYLHHSLQDLEESADRCVFCAMIWERLTIEGFIYHPSSLDEIKKKDLIGIPTIKSQVAHTGIFSFAIIYVTWSGHNWKGITFHRFTVFKAINLGNEDDRAIWKPMFDRQQSLLRIRRWLESSTATSDLRPQLPTRLLHCQPSSPGGDPKVRLVDSINIDPSTRYAALTHRWGAVQPLKLLEARESGFHDNIPFASIPATFQDAIKLANDIGMEYMWIDSLCIVQDSKDDWQAEAARMASVYSQSYVTIAATAAEDSAAGLKQQTTMLRHPCEITPSWTGFEDEIPSGPIRIIIQSGFCDEVLSKPLFRRGWTFQEWILSTRTIHVARDQLWWTSATNMKSQGYAANETCESYDFDVDRNYAHAMAPGALYSLTNESPETLARVWHDLLQEYTSRDLTFESDRLVAFAGIAALYQSFAKLPPGSYLAGIWRQVIPQDLLWSVTDGRKVLPPQLYRGPSWSWASVEPAPNWNGKFSVSMRDINVNLLPKEEPWVAVGTVLEASVEAVSSEFGPVSGGHLVFHGPLIKARLGLVLIDLSNRLTAEQAAEFVPGGKLQYMRNYVSLPDRTGAAAEARAEMQMTMAHLDAALSVVSDEEIDVYLAVIYCRIGLNGHPNAHTLVLVRGPERGEYRRIGYVSLTEDVMNPWKETRDFGVFDALTDENGYLSVGDRPGYYNYRIV